MKAGADVGGTFTDVLMLEPDGSVRASASRKFASSIIRGAWLLSS